ncbi:MAG: hypothetical protein M3461_09490, partial [Pseudomonadota bacterium]|nr:hypothetical protein [Pseudomonadota bacterium]
MNQPTTRWLDLTKRFFDELPPWPHLPATDLAGLRAIAGDWRQRVADFETFRNAELRSHLRRSGIEIIGWRPLRE